MKISVKDPFVNVAVRSVFLNSELLTLCISADEELGEVEVYLVEDGKIVMNNAGDVMTIKRKGDVYINLHEGWEYVGGQLRMAQ